MEIKLLKLHPSAVTPTYAYEGDAGVDLTAVSCRYDKELDNYVYGTGIALAIEKGYVGKLYPRSSNRKTEAYMTNHVGVIDSGYRGEIMVTFKYRDKQNWFVRQLSKVIPCLRRKDPYEVGDKIAQLILERRFVFDFVEVDELSDSERGDKGHGSSGK